MNSPMVDVPGNYHSLNQEACCSRLTEDNVYFLRTSCDLFRYPLDKRTSSSSDLNDRGDMV